jgi:hypothetical protein
MYSNRPIERWTKIQEVWRNLEFHLPPYPEKGIAYIPEADFSIGKSVSLDGDFETLSARILSLLDQKEYGFPLSQLLEDEKWFR